MKVCSFSDYETMGSQVLVASHVSSYSHSPLVLVNSCLRYCALCAQRFLGIGGSKQELCKEGDTSCCSQGRLDSTSSNIYTILRASGVERGALDYNIGNRGLGRPDSNIMVKYCTLSIYKISPIWKCGLGF